MFYTESESVPPAHRCAPVTDSVHVLSAGFSHFKLNAFVDMTPYHGSVTRAILDTGSGLNLVHESFLPQKRRKYRGPLGFRFIIVDANGNRMLHLEKISLTVEFENSQLKISFYAVENLSVPVILGCVFIRRHAKAIHPMDYNIELAE